MIRPLLAVSAVIQDSGQRRRRLHRTWYGRRREIEEGWMLVRYYPYLNVFGALPIFEIYEWREVK